MPEKPKRKPVLAVDLDGVLAEYHGYRGNTLSDLGEPIEGAKEFVERMRRAGWLVVVWSCRPAALLREWADLHGFECDGYNENPQWPDWEAVSGSPKIPADAYLDDRSVEFDQHDEVSDDMWQRIATDCACLGPDQRLRDQAEHEGSEPACHAMRP